MKLVFTLTAGRTGTGFLAELFRRAMPHATVVHEHLDWRAFGSRTPDVSHLVRFNHEGYSDHVRAFWSRKLAAIVQSGASCYVETSHVLMKAGLVEALASLPEEHEIHLVAQRRAHAPTLISYHQRFDFVNLGNRFLWYLDPSYPRNLVKPTPFLGYGVHGTRLWYLLEIETRAAWYAAWVADRPNFRVHHAELEQITRAEGAHALVAAVCGDARDVELPPRVNANRADLPLDPILKNQIEALASTVHGFDAGSLVAQLRRRGTEPFGPPAPGAPVLERA